MHRRRLLRSIAIASLLAGVPGLGAERAGILVLGGTGQLGAEVVRLLAAQGEDVTVFARPTSDRSRLAGLGVRYVTGDLMSEADVAAAFAAGPYRAVINCVRADREVADFYAVTTRHLAAQAKAAGVGQILHHGAVGAGDNMAAHPEVPWASVPGLVARMQDHGAGERNLLASGVPVTIIRNSRVWPDGTPSTGRAELTEDQAVMTPITRADLALLTLECLDNPECYGKIYHARDDSLSWPPPRE